MITCFELHHRSPFSFVINAQAVVCNLIYKLSDWEAWQAPTDGILIGEITTPAIKKLKGFA